VIIHRKGIITLEDIQQVSGLAVHYAQSNADVQTPGQLKSHYAPRKPLFMGLLDELDGLMDQYSRVAVVSFTPKELVPPYTSFALSETGNLAEAAARLFGTLRQLDEDDAVDAIVAEPVPMQGIGMAINDRLHRAQHQWKQDD
jgi:L-threonylcarbamoyladenylate synthase